MAEKDSKENPKEVSNEKGIDVSKMKEPIKVRILKGHKGEGKVTEVSKQNCEILLKKKVVELVEE